LRVMVSLRNFRSTIWIALLCDFSINPSYTK
jgi:hypothetical protein